MEGRLKRTWNRQRGWSLKWTWKKKRGIGRRIKGRKSRPLEYERRVCLRLFDHNQHWLYVVNLSSKDEEKRKEFLGTAPVVVTLGDGIQFPLSSMSDHNQVHEDGGEDLSSPPILNRVQWKTDGSSNVKGCLFAAIGSILYQIGGVASDGEKPLLLSPNVFYVDTSILPIGDPSWRRAADMLYGRSDKEAKAVVLDGKIYVLGGDVGCGDIWGEVFDPSGVTRNHLGEWRAIAKPPPELRSIIYGSFFVSALGNSKKILVLWQIIPKLFAYFYDAEYNIWRKYDGGLLAFRDRLLTFRKSRHEDSFCRTLVVGNCIYWISDRLYCYDLDQEILFSGFVEDLHILQYLHYHGLDEVSRRLFTLVHLVGDFFCLLWLRPDWPQSIVHCTKLHVSKGTSLKDGRGLLWALVVSCNSYNPLEPGLDQLDASILV